MDSRSIVRTIVLIVALINQVLTASGHSPLPFDDEAIDTGVSTILTVAVSIWTWWKNNYISSTGIQQKEVLQKNGLYKK